jgi:uncharacterized protein YidB (DUF937 family)
MGLFDSILGAVTGQQSGDGSQGALLTSVIGMVVNHEGGLPGLLDKFKAGGLGDQVNSWVGLGQNQTITADQITQVLGHGKLAELARQAGLTPDQIAAGLAEHLPKVVDKLTPNGTVPDGSVAAQAEKLLKAYLAGQH